MASGVTRGLLEQLIARDALTQLIDDVRETGARLMPLKGVLLVALGIRKAADRSMADVDVLVEPSVARPVTRAARSHGWLTPMGNDTACVLVHPKTRATSIDLHRALFPPHFFGMDTDGVFERARRDDKLFTREVYVMHPLDLYAHLVGHFVKGRSDRRDHRHLTDFAAVGRWSGASPSECAAHLERVGLARAARYALNLALDTEADSFTREVLRRLPKDRRGSAMAMVADRVLSRVEPGSDWGIPFVHALNTNLARASRSLLSAITEPNGDDRSRDGWWRA
jgi:hypothetical protein